MSLENARFTQEMSDKMSFLEFIVENIMIYVLAIKDYMSTLTYAVLEESIYFTLTKATVQTRFMVFADFIRRTTDVAVSETYVI